MHGRLSRISRTAASHYGHFPCSRAARVRRTHAVALQKIGSWHLLRVLVLAVDKAGCHKHTQQARRGVGNPVWRRYRHRGDRFDYMLRRGDGWRHSCLTARNAHSSICTRGERKIGTETVVDIRLRHTRCSRWLRMLTSGNQLQRIEASQLQPRGQSRRQ